MPDHQKVPFLFEFLSSVNIATDVKLSSIKTKRVFLLIESIHAQVICCRSTTKNDGHFLEWFCESEGKLNADSYTNPGMLGFCVLNLAEVDHANFRYLCHSRGTFPNLSQMPHQESLKIKLNSLVLTLLKGLHFRVFSVCCYKRLALEVRLVFYTVTNIWFLK